MTGTSKAPFTTAAGALRRLAGLLLALGFIGAVAACSEADDPVGPDTDFDPPSVAREIDDQHVQADEEALAWDLAEVFDDPAGEGLDYGAETSDAEVVDVSVREATLTVEPAAGGKATVTAKAENKGGAAETSFQVQVDLPDPPDRPD